MINNAFHRLNVNILSVKYKGLQGKIHYIAMKKIKTDNQHIAKPLLARAGQRAGKAWSASGLKGTKKKNPNGQLWLFGFFIYSVSQLLSEEVVGIFRQQSFLVVCSF